MREIRIQDTLSGELRPLEPREPGEGGHLRLRPDRLRPGARRQRAAVRGLRPAQALPRARGLRGDAGRERHRRERQDLRRRPRGAGVPSEQLAARDDRAYVADTDGLGLGPPRPRAEGGRDDRPDRRPDRRPGATAGTPTTPTATCTSRCASFDGYGKLSNRPPDQMRAGRGRRRRRAQAESPRTSRSGRPTRRARTPPGARPGASAGPAGTSSARRWPRRSSAPTSRSTAAAPTWSSPTTRTRSPRPRRPAASRWRASGCTTGWSRWAPRRWPSRSGTSACCTPRSRSTGATRWSCTSPAGTTASRSRSRARRSRRPARGRRAAARARAPARPRRAARRRALDAYVERFFDALADDFNTPAARAVLFEWVGEAQPAARRGRGARRRARWARCCTRSGWRACSSPSSEPADDGRGAAARASARRPGPTRDFERADELRDELAARGLRGARHARGRAARARGGDRLRPQPRARGAARAAAGAHAEYGRPRRAAEEPWLAGVDVQVVQAHEIEGLCESPDHQGICAEAGGYPYADPSRLLGADDALVLVPSTRCRTRRTSARSAGSPSRRGPPAS